jgi:AraC-like DNA-binding protein
MTRKQGDYWIQASPVARLGDLARERGLDWDEILDRYDLNPCLVLDPETRIPVDVMFSIFNQVAKSLRDDACVLDLFYEIPLGFTRGFDYVGLYADSIRSALQNWADYSQLRSNYARISYTESGGSGYLTWSLPPTHLNFRQFSHAFIGWAVGRIEMILGGRTERIEIHLRSPEPTAPSQFLKKYRPQVKFEQPDHCVIVPGDLLGDTPPMADPTLLKIIEKHVLRSIEKQTLAASPVHRIREAMSEAMNTGDCSVEAVSRKLGMSRRTLQRTLADNNTSFRSLLSDVRRIRAKHYLAETNLTIKEIAHLLGFSEMSAFSRAAKAWFGKSPKSVRLEAGVPQE